MADDLQSKASDMIKKLLTVGVGAVFLTEESLRSLVSEFKVPKEFLGGILDAANKTRKEFFQGLSQDLLNRLTEKMDVRDLVRDVLARNDINVQIKVSFSEKAEKREK